MVRRVETDPIDGDERLGEAIEAYLTLAEEGRAPDPDEFAARYPDLGPDLRDALEGLALVQGLVGDPRGPGHGLESGRRIAGYRIVRELGRGGMGIVYEAVHVGLDRPVALKVLGTHAAPDSNGRRRFLNEARTAAGLHHTHIVPVFDVGQVGGLCYYAMQRIEGAGLDRVLRHLRRDRSIAAGSSQGHGHGLGQGQGGTTTGRGGRTQSQGARPSTPTGLEPAARPLPAPPLSLPLPSLVDDTASWQGRSNGLAREAGLGQHLREPDDAPPPFEPPRGSAYYRWVAEIGRQAAEALQHAHNRGVVHRDIKPSNLLVDARGIVWVADFGLARRLADPSQTQHDSLLGTPRYMSPEQARIGPIDGRSDVYSLGATLYELLTLRPPFEGRTAAELVEQIAGREPTPPRRYDARLPRDLETILIKALSKRPADRYPTAQDLADDLKRFLSHEPVRARRISPLGRFWRFTRRHPSQTIVSATAAATVLAVLTGAYVRIMQQRDQATAAMMKTEAANRATQAAMMKTEAANRATQAAYCESLGLQASLVRLSNLPNRRARGLGLLAQAAALKPNPTLGLRLRDEAVGFLMLRDVEARPGFATGATRGLVFAAEGTRLATIQEDGEELGLWDVERRQLLANPRLRPASTANPDAPAVAAGNRRGTGPGSYVAALGQGLTTILPSGRGLRLFDAVTGEFVRDLRTPDRQFRAVFATSNGRRLVTIEQIPPTTNQTPRRGGPGSGPGSGSEPGASPEPAPRSEYLVNLWNPERWAPESMGAPIATLARWEIPARGSSPFPTPQPLVALSPDGSVIATAQQRNSVVAFWSAEDGDSLGEIETTAELRALALGPDNLMATAGGGTIQLWDIDSETALGQLSPRQSDVQLLRFHPRGTLLASAGRGSEIELWDPASRDLVAVLPVGETDRSDPLIHDNVQDFAFSPDGRTLVASSRGATTPAWQIVDPVAQSQLSGFDSPPTSLALRDDGLLAVASFRGSLWFWMSGHCASNLQPVRGTARPGDPTATTTPSAVTAAAATATPGLTPAATAPPAAANPVAAMRPTSLVFDDRGRLLALDQDALRGWGEPPRDTEAFRIPVPASAESSGGLSRMFRSPSAIPMVRSPDGQTIYLARQSQILVWHSSAPEALQPLSLPSLPEPPEFDHERRPEPPDPERDRERERDRGRWLSWQKLAVAADGSRLYLVDNWGRVHALALDADHGRWLDWSLDLRARTLALSPDGKTLAVADRGRQPSPSDGRTHPPGSNSNSSSNDRGRPGSVALIDTDTGTEVGRLEPTTDEAEGQLLVLAFAPNSHELAIGTQQGVVDLWSLDHPSAPRIHLRNHRGSVNTLAFDPQGRHLVSGGMDRTVAVWDLKLIRDELQRLGLGW